jgi:hypothetical protein
MDNTREVVIVALGDNAQREAALLKETILRVHDWRVSVESAKPNTMSNVQASRWAKVNLDNNTEAECTLYLDADTRVHGDISAGFDILADGWDIAMAHSANQESDKFWHLLTDERAVTYNETCFDPLQMQCGVLFVRWSELTRSFFREWRAEWSRWMHQDQGAFVRALYRHPVRIWLLGRPWNGGGLIAHYFGRAREQ